MNPASMIRYIYLVPILLGITLPAGADEPRLSIGPGLVTFSEIAAALSVGGHRVEAAADVRDSAAFVRIKDRPWSQARDLLCRGLDVMFKEPKDPKGAALLTRDPSVTNQEQSWRGALARNIRSFILAKVPTALKLAGQSPEALKAQEDEMKQKLDALEKDGTKDSPRYHDLSTAFDKVRLAAQWGPQERLFASWLSTDFPSVDKIRRAVDVGWTAWVFPTTRFPTDVLAPVLERIAKREPDAHYESAMGVVEVTPYPVNLLAGFNLYLVSEGGFASMQSPGAASINVRASLTEDEAPASDNPLIAIDWIFQGKRSTGSVEYNGLGDDAATWLRLQRKRTAAFLKTARANVRITVPRRWPDSLSQWIEAWCGKVDGEAVMELCPGGEWGEDTNGSQHPNQAYSLAELYTGPSSGSFGAWTFEESNGTLLVKNQFAFLFRARKRPVASLVRLLRRVAMPDEPTGREVSDSPPPREPASLDGLAFPIIRDYVRDVTASPHSYWSFPQVFADRYRGYWLPDLDHAVPTVTIWDRLPADERLRLAGISGPSRKENYPITKLGLADQRLAGRSIQAWGVWIWANLARDPAEFARSETLVVQSTSIKDKPGTYRLRLDLDPPIWGTTCDILWSLR